MRVYVPAEWGQLAALQVSGRLSGPLRGITVDPQWRADAPDVDEEEWEYEAAQLAAEELASRDGRGMILAVEVPAEGLVAEDGWLVLPGPVHRRQVGGLLGADLAWFGLQELAGLLADR